MINTEKYLKGLKAGIGMGIAYIPFGLTVGLIAKNNGMYTIVTAAMSFGIYAGGSEAMLLKMVYVQHSTAIEVIISVLMINLRYLLLNLLIFRQLKNGTKLFEKILVGVGLTDETINKRRKFTLVYHWAKYNSVFMLCWKFRSRFTFWKYDT